MRVVPSIRNGAEQASANLAAQRGTQQHTAQHQYQRLRHGVPPPPLRHHAHAHRRHQRRLWVQQQPQQPPGVRDVACNRLHVGCAHGQHGQGMSTYGPAAPAASLHQCGPQSAHDRRASPNGRSAA
jgi:hypothetical protein